MSVDLGDLSVLIMDDDVFLVKLMKRVLQNLGIDKIQQAHDGVAALECLKKSMVDVVLSDLNMPGMDGVEFLRSLTELEVQPAVILVSGETKEVLKSVEQFGNALKLTILGVLTKPINKEQLEKILLKRALSEHQAR